jgi:hypothetical protein
MQNELPMTKVDPFRIPSRGCCIECRCSGVLVKIRKIEVFRTSSQQLLVFSRELE